MDNSNGRETAKERNRFGTSKFACRIQMPSGCGDRDNTNHLEIFDDPVLHPSLSLWGTSTEREPKPLHTAGPVQSPLIFETEPLPVHRDWTQAEDHDNTTQSGFTRCGTTNNLDREFMAVTSGER